MAKRIITPSGRSLTNGECELCGDTGIIPLVGRPETVSFEDIWKWQAPCGCRVGDQWREEAALCLNPPPCETGCGRPAEYTLTTFPRCAACDRERIAEARHGYKAADYLKDLADMNKHRTAHGLPPEDRF